MAKGFDIVIDERGGWESDTGWANDTHAIASKVIYHDVPISAEPVKMEPDDIEHYGMITDEQLQRGGVRLAAILNNALK